MTPSDRVTSGGNGAPAEGRGVPLHTQIAVTVVAFLLWLAFTVLHVRFVFWRIDTPADGLLPFLPMSWVVWAFTRRHPVAYWITIAVVLVLSYFINQR